MRFLMFVVALAGFMLAGCDSDSLEFPEQDPPKGDLEKTEVVVKDQLTLEALGGFSTGVYLQINSSGWARVPFSTGETRAAILLPEDRHNRLLALFDFIQEVPPLPNPQFGCGDGYDLIVTRLSYYSGPVVKSIGNCYIPTSNEIIAIQFKAGIDSLFAIRREILGSGKAEG